MLPLDNQRRLESEARFAIVVLDHRGPAAAERRTEVDELVRGSVESTVADPPHAHTLPATHLADRAQRRLRAPPPSGGSVPFAPT